MEWKLAEPFRRLSIPAHKFNCQNPFSFFFLTKRNLICLPSSDSSSTWTRFSPLIRIGLSGIIPRRDSSRLRSLLGVRPPRPKVKLTSRISPRERPWRKMDSASRCGPPVPEADVPGGSFWFPSLLSVSRPAGFLLSPPRLEWRPKNREIRPAPPRKGE